jgi:hypothetical protein
MEIYKTKSPAKIILRSLFVIAVEASLPFLEYFKLSGGVAVF